MAKARSRSLEVAFLASAAVLALVVSANVAYVDATTRFEFPVENRAVVINETGTLAFVTLWVPPGFVLRVPPEVAQSVPDPERFEFIVMEGEEGKRLVDPPPRPPVNVHYRKNLTEAPATGVEVLRPSPPKDRCPEDAPECSTFTLDLVWFRAHEDADLEPLSDPGVVDAMVRDLSDTSALRGTSFWVFHPRIQEKQPYFYAAQGTAALVTAVLGAVWFLAGSHVHPASVERERKDALARLTDRLAEAWDELRGALLLAGFLALLVGLLGFIVFRERFDRLEGVAPGRLWASALVLGLGLAYFGLLVVWWKRVQAVGDEV